MCLDVTYKPYATSSKEQTGDIIMLKQFEEENLLSETREDADSSEKSDDDSIMPPLISEEEMNVMDSGGESDDEPMSKDILEDIFDGSKSHPKINRREACYKIHDRIKERQPECKGALKAMRNLGISLHKVFKTFFKEILQDLPPLGESGSEVSYCIPEPRNF